MASAVEEQPLSEPCPTPVDGGTLVPPSGTPEVTQTALQGLNSADSSLISDTLHVQQLINHGADVNAPDNNGWTPLHTAAYHGQEEIVRILLTANANVNARNRSEETPLHLAAKWPQDRVVEALLSRGADLTARNKRGRTPAHVASLFNRHAILDRLLSAGADVNAVDSDLQTPLHLAVRANCPVEPELVKTLIRHSADLELRDVKGNAPLHFLPNTQDWLHWAAYEGKEGLMQILLAKPGIRPDCYSEEGLTPLHLAAHINNTNMVTMLLNAGAKVNAPSQPPTKTSGKETTYGIPLPGAPGSITAGISISSQLKAYGSSKLPPGELTALHIAAERGSAELIRVLVAAGAKVNVQGERGMPPLHVAVWEGNTAAVVSLLAAKASVSLKSKAGGFTSVHCACLSSRATPELLALLLDNGGAAVIEERCQEGWTALHLACQSAPPTMVELLLQRGARPGAKGKNGRTAADCASKRPEILQILHVATGGKVPLPLGLTSMAAAAANGLLVPNGSAASNGGGAGGGSGSRTGSGGVSSGGRSRGGGGSGPGSGGTSRSLSSSSQSGLLPGTAAVLEPLESVEATLAALLADMGGALCSLQAGAVFGAGACAVDPVGHCIRPVDKRLVMMCTLGCTFSFHLQCWMSAREVLKERWSGFTGSLAAGGRYCCIAPGCQGYIREQTICDGTQMQASNQSRLYLMPQDVYDSLPPQAKPIGGGVPLPPGSGDGCISGMGGLQQAGTPLQPALPAGGGGLQSSFSAFGPSLTLAQAMVQAATAVGNMVGGSGRLGPSQLAAALAATGGLPALLANPPPIPQAMSAREAAIIAAQTLGVGQGGSGSGSCVVEDLSSDEEDLDGVGLGSFGVAGPSSGGPGGRGGAGAAAASRSGGLASTSSGSGSGGMGSGTANGGSSGRKHGGGGGGSSSSSSRRGAKGGGGKALGAKASPASPISSAATAEMLQQLQGLQQAVAAVQSAVGAGVHSMGLMGSGGGGSTGAAAATAAAAASATLAGGADTAGAATATGSRAPTPESGTVATLEPLPLDVRPPGSSGVDVDGGGATAGGDHPQHSAPMPPPRRRTPQMPLMSRRSPQPLSCATVECGRQPVSPQLATPPPATSLHTPGVQQLLATAAAVAGVTPAPTPTAGASSPRQPDAALAPILVGPVPQPVLPASSGTSAASGLDKGTSLASRSGEQLPEDQAAKAAPTAVSNVPVAAAGAGATAGSSKVEISTPSASTSASKSRASPRRSAGSAGAGGPVLGSAPPGSAKSEFLAAITNGQAAAAAYGGRITLTAPGLSIGFVRGVPLATTTTVPAAEQAQALPGLKVVRTPAGKPGGPQGSLPLNPANFEPGGYARAVCPGLQPGVHRVTHSSGRVPPPPGATIVPSTVTPAGVVTSAAVRPDHDGAAKPSTSEASPVGGMSSEAGASSAPAAVAATQTAPAAAAEDRAADGSSCVANTFTDGGPAVSAPPQPPPVKPESCGPDVLATEVGPRSPVPLLSPSASRPVIPIPVPVPEPCVVSPPPESAADDIVLSALRGLQAAGDVQAPVGLSAAVAAALEAAPVDPPAPTAEGSVAGVAATGAISKHLLLQSSDIPLLASTPGMLEAWLSAHVATHGRLAAHRILADQAAVAVTLESDAAADAAARSLRQRPTLLVHPLAVAPLRDFPEDDVLAASAQQVAKAGCPPGDRSWMRQMVQLWERLQTLPPAVRYD